MLAEAAQREAVALFGNAGPADPRHPYLVDKQVRAHGIRQRGDELLVPRHDMGTGELVNLQRILPNGDKRNLKDGRVDGTWFIIGRPQAQGTILLGEGFATCATAHEDTGHAAVVAFGSDNLEAAAVELRKQYPQARIIVLADDDWKKPGNPGLTKAKEAASAADALLAVPKFGAGSRGQGHRLQRYAPACWCRCRQGRDRERQRTRRVIGPTSTPALVEGTRRDDPGISGSSVSSAGANGSSQPPRARGAGRLRGPGTACLVAGVTGCGVKVQATPSWSEPLILWLALVGAPSTGKSPALDAARQLIDAVESEAKEGDEERRRLHETNVEAAKVAAESLARGSRR